MGTFLLVLALVAGSPPAQAPFPERLDTQAIGAAAFLAAHHDGDGRGVAIAVLDTGVDMGVAGLVTTSTGAAKVVEARDFTGEAVIDCDPATVEKGEDGQEVWRGRCDPPTLEKGEDGRDVQRRRCPFVKGVKAIPGLPDGAPVFVGFLDEKKYRNSSVPDLNGNGRNDDTFALVLFKGTDGQWRVVIDRGADHDVTGDSPVRSYEIAHEFLTLGGQDPSRAPATMHLAAHIEASDDGAHRVELHIPAGSHGTHVAGIAAGYRLNGVDGYDGVAPGAVLLSLKIGNNTLAGGSSVTESMKKAVEFAGRWGRDHKMPVVINMSYGVGSEIEGQADIEKFLDLFAEDNPHVVIVLSAGNGGPGLSTVGSPAAALHSLAVAAAFTPGMAKDLLGATVPGDRLFQFSARGGELAKPDVAAPGIAASTVPPWAKGDLMRGTSMAAPQGAGAAALILSAALAKSPDAAWGSGELRRALRDTARPIKGYGPLDQGGGMIDVGKAFEAFQARLGDAGAAALIGIEVQTPSPTMGARKARASFWRAGGWAPDEAHPTVVTVKARFATATSAKVRSESYLSLSLSADERWVKLSRGSVYLKGEAEATFELWVDPSAVEEPGVHVATVTLKGGGVRTAFPVTVVTPYAAKAVDGVPAVRAHGLRLNPSDVLRFPLAPPPGTTAMQISVAPTRDQKAAVFAYLFDPHGRRIPLTEGSAAASEQGTHVETTLSLDDFLDNGTVELDLFAPPATRYASEVDLDVRFLALDADPIRSWSMEGGLPPKARVDVLNEMPGLFQGSVRGQIDGCERTFRKTLLQEPLREGFHVSREIEGVEFDLKVSAEDAARFTDLAFSVLDKDGTALVKEGFEGRAARVRFKNPDPSKAEGDYTLEVVAGRAIAGGPQVSVEVVERHLWRERVALTGTTPGGDQRVQLFPTVATPVDVKAGATPRSCAPGSGWHGFVEFVNQKDGLTWLRLPVRVRP